MEVASFYFALETRSTCPGFCVSNTLKRLSITISALHLENNNVAPGGQGNNNVLSTFFHSLRTELCYKCFWLILTDIAIKEVNFDCSFFSSITLEKAAQQAHSIESC